ncbi:putative 40S ribosomal protein S27-like [Scophthalmus maximus]|uniref:Putative 40S ribosomal protein S27-like n=1 Tax=Scophthalmus maximus TaxID=52904 RepID=A0A2U9C3T1_SCOMX|nr:putative 40S ribosomal protein S27-like [Scophthalmus maximus]
MHPSFTEERRRHKKKRLVQSPNSYFMDVKCMGCYRITTIFSHAQIVAAPSEGKTADQTYVYAHDGQYG